MKTTVAAYLVLLPTFGAAACASSGNGTADFAGSDAGDAASAVEAGESSDSGGRPMTDGGSMDSGSDAGSQDAGRTNDGSMTDAGTDTGVPEGGATDGGTCGGATCFSGQSCVLGSCQFTQCQGAQVPGDYATIQAAVSALAATGGTICLAAQTYDESVVITNTADSTLAFQGVSPSASIVKSISLSWSTYQSRATLPTLGLQFKGLWIGALELEPPAAATMSLTAVKLGGSQFSAAGATAALSIIFGAYDNMNPLQTASLDGVDVSAPGGTAVMMDMYSSDGANGQDSLSIVNSYVHDSSTGLALDEAFRVTLEDDTIESNTTGVSQVAPVFPSTAAFTVYNNLFVTNGTALSLLESPPTVSQGNNAFYGNTTKFSGTAVEGTSDVNADPKLDTSTTPPGLLPGSPCRGAGASGQSPADDFWGRTRGTSIDLGAVQSP